MRNFHKIHPTALIGDNVSLGKDVTIGAHTIVYDNVSLGDGSSVGANCILGEPQIDFYAHSSDYRNPALSIGEHSLIRSGTTIYAGTEIGAHFECGHGVTIREAARIARHVRVGTLSDIQGHCSIGDYARLHSGVFVAHKSVIKNFVWLFPHVVLTNDPHPPSEAVAGVTIEDFAVLAARSVILAGVTVGMDALVGASSFVRTDVPAEAIFAGNPARQIGSIHDVKSRSDGSPVYPWRESFDRGMPWQGIGYKAWKASLAPTGAEDD